ncbi:MAG: DUF11 domain-containing protein, partial [Pirellulaceae bacterium]|nr:DUF11 domain-containing protein [Pirellulaceae bacterium]
VGDNDNLLEVGEIWRYTGTYAITQADIDAGGVLNTALVTANDPTDTPVTDQGMNDEPIPQVPAIDLEKEGTLDTTIVPPTNRADVGDRINYVVTVANTGNVTLDTVQVSGPLVTLVRGPDLVGDNDNLLEVGEVWRYTGIYVLTQADLDAGQRLNTAFVTANDPNDNPVTDQDTNNEPLPQLPAIDLEKDGTLDTTVVPPSDRADVGDRINYVVTVANTGNVTLDTVQVSDPLVTLVRGPDLVGDNDNLLEVGEVWRYTGIYVITQADIDAGRVLNTALVTANDPNDNRVPDEDTNEEPIPRLPAIDLDKALSSNADEDGSGTVTVGDTLTYSFLVTNTGNVTLTNVQVVDPLAGGLVTLSTTTLVPGQTAIGTTNYQVTPEDASIGVVVNLAVASGLPPGGVDPVDRVTDEDEERVPVVVPVVVIANDKGVDSKPLVTILDQSGKEILGQFLAYEADYAGGVRIAVGDVNGDGVDDIVTAPGLGREPEVKVFSRPDPADPSQWVELTEFRFLAYPASFDGGVEIALGDFDNDGRGDDIVATPSFGAVQTRVFLNRFETNPASPIDTVPFRSFFAFSSSFTGGSVVAAADMNGAGPDEVIVGSGSGMRATVRIYNISGTPSIIRTILPFYSFSFGGVSLDVGRVNADATPDLVIGNGYRGWSIVEVYNGATGAKLTTFQAFEGTSYNSPVRVAFQDVDNDGRADRILAVQGPDGAVNELRAFDLVFGNNDALSAVLNPAASIDLDDLEDDCLFGAYFL